METAAATAGWGSTVLHPAEFDFGAGMRSWVIETAATSSAGMLYSAELSDTIRRQRISIEAAERDFAAHLAREIAGEGVDLRFVERFESDRDPDEFWRLEVRVFDMDAAQLIEAEESFAARLAHRYPRLAEHVVVLFRSVDR